MLLKVNNQSLDKQKEILDKTIEEWRGDHDQADDIAIYGVRI